VEHPRSDADAAHPFEVSVIGLGYVGLPTAAVLATAGQRVAGVDLRPEIVDTINAGAIHIVEPELDALVRAAVAAGTLRAHLTPQPARAHLICVPTPLGPGRAPGLDHVAAAAEALLEVLRPGDLVVLESTVPPGTTRAVIGERVRARGFTPGVDIFIAHAPERVLPGAVIREVVDNPRVIGGLTDACTARCAAFYERFVRGELLRTSAETAELCKLAENAFRDVNIAFANELAAIAGHLHVDIWELIALANRHPRVQILRPGPGVGGHCIAVDPWFIVASAPAHSALIQAARAVNDARPGHVIAEVHRLAQSHRGRPRVALLGLSYKPDIDDLRESPALAIARALAEAPGLELMLVEPHLSRSPIEGHALHDPHEALAAADIAVILVAHRAFRRLPRELFLAPRVLDTVGLLAAPIAPS
jgi:UDP-N-acetyl-D-mannosaminuronic acid dehydrogenase